MRIVDFHNHYYPPAYLDALKSGASTVKVTIDDDGNPRLYYPGDYNIAVLGHRDIDYRERVLIEHGVDTQVLTLTTPERTSSLPRPPRAWPAWSTMHSALSWKVGKPASRLWRPCRSTIRKRR
jgi:hypothetical protein